MLSEYFSDRSMNGIITLSDGQGTSIENGAIVCEKIRNSTGDIQEQIDRLGNIHIGTVTTVPYPEYPASVTITKTATETDFNFQLPVPEYNFQIGNVYDVSYGSRPVVSIIKDGLDLSFNFGIPVQPNQLVAPQSGFFMLWCENSGTGFNMSKINDWSFGSGSQISNKIVIGCNCTIHSIGVSTTSNVTMDSFALIYNQNDDFIGGVSIGNGTGGYFETNLDNNATILEGDELRIETIQGNGSGGTIHICITFATAGIKGEHGKDASVSIGTVRTTQFTTNPTTTITNSGSASDAIFNFNLPVIVPKFDVSYSIVNSDIAGNITVTEKTDFSNNWLINMTIPKGQKGDTGVQGSQGGKGDRGDKGDKGEKGDAGDITQASIAGGVAGAISGAVAGALEIATALALGGGIYTAINGGVNAGINDALSEAGSITSAISSALTSPLSRLSNAEYILSGLNYTVLGGMLFTGGFLTIYSQSTINKKFVFDPTTMTFKITDGTKTTTLSTDYLEIEDTSITNIYKQNKLHIDSEKLRFKNTNDTTLFLLDSSGINIYDTNGNNKTKINNDGSMYLASDLSCNTTIYCNNLQAKVLNDIYNTFNIGGVNQSVYICGCRFWSFDGGLSISMLNSNVNGSFYIGLGAYNFYRFTYTATYIDADVYVRANSTSGIAGNISAEGDISGNKFYCSTAPTTANELCNKTYVDNKSSSGGYFQPSGGYGDIYYNNGQVKMGAGILVTGNIIANNGFIKTDSFIGCSYNNAGLNSYPSIILKDLIVVNRSLASQFNPLVALNDTSIIYNYNSGDTLGSNSNGLCISPWSSTSSGIRMDNSGNFGLNISPNYPLDVSGNIHTNANIYLENDGTIRSKTTTGGVVDLLQLINTNDVYMNYPNFMTLRTTGGSNAITLNSSGYVGIGPSINPSYPLDCNGVINTNSSFKSSLNNAGLNATSVFETIDLIIVPRINANSYNSKVKANDTAIIYNYNNGTTPSTNGLCICPWYSGSGGIRMDSSGNVDISGITQSTKFLCTTAPTTSNELCNKSYVDGIILRDVSNTYFNAIYLNSPGSIRTKDDAGNDTPMISRYYGNNTYITYGVGALRMRPTTSTSETMVISSSNIQCNTHVSIDNSSFLKISRSSASSYTTGISFIDSTVVSQIYDNGDLHIQSDDTIHFDNNSQVDILKLSYNSASFNANITANGTIQCYNFDNNTKFCKTYVSFSVNVNDYVYYAGSSTYTKIFSNNVSTVMQQGSYGTYRINFTNNLPNTQYLVSISGAWQDDTNNNITGSMIFSSVTTKNIAYVDIQILHGTTFSDTQTSLNSAHIDVMIYY